MKNADSVTFTAIIHKKSKKIFDFYQILLKNVKNTKKPVIVTTITGQKL